MTADADRPADARDVIVEALCSAQTRYLVQEGRTLALAEPLAAAVLAALSSAGLTVVPTDSLPEWRCPSCGAVTRARMADTPTGEPREEWCVRRPDGALVRDNFTREQAVDLIRIEETCADGIRGCELMRRTVHTGPWLPAEPEAPGVPG